MPTYKLTIEYEGTRYSGWQAQGNTPKTIQGHLLRAATQVLGDCDIGGAGRTDYGVHAAAQGAHLRARKGVEPLVLSRNIKERVPHDTASDAAPRAFAPALRLAATASASASASCWPSSKVRR